MQRLPRSVIYLIWKDPWMTVSPDTYIADALACVGLQVRAPMTGRRYPEIDWDTFALDRHDVRRGSSDRSAHTTRG